jgi:hypothetical protein
MKLTIRDAIASVLVAAILVPYAGYLWQGEMPFIQDPRGMSATALILGVAAFLTAGRLFHTGTLGKVETGLAVVSVVVGIAALLLAETVAAEALLAAFIATIVVVWAVQMLHHAGFITTGTTRSAALHR